MTKHTSILIIGSGPSGYTAAIYSARAMLQPIIISGIQQGGQLMITNDVENYPGFAAPISGPFLMEQMKQQAQRVGAQIVHDIITHVNLEERPFSLTTESGDSYTCDALIIASGAAPRWLNVPGEKELMGFGVSSCATCDGFFYRGKDVLVVGGGNTAFEEALYLSSLAKNVFLVHRRDSFRAEKLLQNRLLQQKNIHILTNTVIKEIIGTQDKRPFVSHVALQNLTTHSTTTMPIDAVFVAIGHVPAVDLFVGVLQQKESGHIWTVPGSTVTSIPGVFAAGDVVDDVYRQAITAAGSGCMAALDAEKYLLRIIAE